MPTTPPTITPGPTAPQRNDKTTFSARVDAFVTWLIAAVAQFLAVATNVYNNAVEAFNSATAAAGSATAASGSAQTAQDAAAAAAVNANATLWVSGQTVNLDQAKISPLDRRTYRRKTATGVSNTDPALDSTNYVLLSAGTYAIFHAREEYASGTNSPLVAASTETNVTRVQNAAKSNSISGASLASNQYTLPVGTYKLKAVAPISGSLNASRAYWYCVTDGVVVMYGPSGGGTDRNTVDGVFSVTGTSKVYELRQYVRTGGGSVLLGAPVTQPGQVEVYSETILEKLS